MYVVFIQRSDRRFVVRGIRSSDSHLPPDDDWETAGEVEGYLDTLAFVQTQATAKGWRDYTVEFQDVHRN